MNVKILGSTCAKCHALEQKIRFLNEAHQLNLQIEKVTDLKEMMQYRIMTTPGLVVDGELKSYGTIPKDDQLLRWFQEKKP
jgi:small redox-active disulfide protein 2